MAFDNDGVFLDVREISWHATEAGEIYRRECVAGASCLNGDAAPVLMGTGIRKFHLTPSIPGVLRDAAVSDDTLFKPDGVPGFGLASRETGNGKARFVRTSTGPNAVRVYDFAQNPENDMMFNQVYLTAPNSSACEPFNFYKGETYKVEFQMPILGGDETDSLITQFQPGVDHIAVGFRQAADGSVFLNGPVDALFYPAQSGALNQAKMSAEFSPGANLKNACVALTFAFYSPLAYKGSLHFQSFRVLRKTDEAFHFLKPGDSLYNENYGTEAINPLSERIRQKTRAKAFEMILEVERSSEKTRSSSDDGNGMVILTPNNGVKASRRTSAY
jgi:hypothetical protein